MLCGLPPVPWRQTKPTLGFPADPAAVVSLGLVLACPFNEGGGAKAFDLSGNGNTGALTGGAVYNGSGSIVFTEASGQTVSFGTKNVPTVQGVKSFRVRLVELDNGTAGQSIFTMIDAGVSNAIQLTQKLAGTGLAISQFGGTILVSQGGTTAVGVMTDCAYTYDGTTHSFYINGRLVGTSAGASQTGTTGNIYLSTYNGTAEPFDGTVSDVLLANKCWTPGQVMQLYEQPFSWVQPMPRRAWSLATPGAAGGVLLPRVMTWYEELSYADWL